MESTRRAMKSDSVRADVAREAEAGVEVGSAEVGAR